MERFNGSSNMVGARQDHVRTHDAFACSTSSLFHTMVAIVNRRALIGSIVSTTLCSSSVLVEDVAKFIISSTPRDFREAVAQSNHFLYRGEEQRKRPPPQMAGQVCSPTPDLLLKETYKDENAVLYFQCLEDYLTKEAVTARPSTGHIGTPVIRDAGQWGDVVSVWPLGDQMSFVYPKNEKTFFPDCTCEAPYVMNHDLATALVEGKEVLFASWYSKTESSPSSSFLVVPQKNDKRLKRILESMQYGLN